MTTPDTFETTTDGRRLRLGRCAFVLRGFALSCADELRLGIADIETRSPFRSMVTPGGYSMSAASTNCGTLGWTSDRRGYRYTRVDPVRGTPWPGMPGAFAQLARRAAEMAGFKDFVPDACLINRYLPGTRLSLHQDRDERDFDAPIVSVSLGMPATFLFGGHARSDRAAKIPLCHGDVAVWGGPDRLRYHGVAALRDEPHPLMGSRRINLTFRKAG
ncbi:MAG TPA: DNA oxidative demethylase AlkB [Steroidobacteraceae bacterium]|jgi:alkylated DNA repair protein (DNA oxidative demethylase)|nr:DNA oxidative demethylase AlkB [Steroidobacteraceae bacterium]